MKNLIFAGICFGCLTVARADTQLGIYVFDDALFGSVLQESDGGQFSSVHWLSAVNSPPGNPAVLTGAGFNTGVANIGAEGPVIYTIHYGQPVVNGPEADLAVVFARFPGEVQNAYDLEVSQDGIAFSPVASFSTSTGVNTGVDQSYFYQNSGPHAATLYVQPIDLSDFGVPLGGEIQAIRISGSLQFDLIRVAGFAPIPEPTGFALAGLFGLALVMGRRR